MRDLEIRGAGDLLGAEQSGHVAALGFELYVELLARGGRRALRAAPHGRAAGPRRRARRRLRARRRTSPPRRSDRPPPPARAHRGRGRAARARRRRPRTATARCPSPSRTCSRSRRRSSSSRALGADYLVFRGGRVDRRPARPRLRRAARAARAASTPRSTRPPQREVSLRDGRVRGGASIGRCYPRRAPGSLSRAAHVQAFAKAISSQ